MVHNNTLGTIIGISLEVRIASIVIDSSDMRATIRLAQTVKRRASIHKMVDSGALQSALQRIQVPAPGEADRAHRTHEPHHSFAPYPPPQYQPPSRPYPTNHSGTYRSLPPHLERTGHGPRSRLSPVPPAQPPVPSPAYSSASYAPRPSVSYSSRPLAPYQTHSSTPLLVRPPVAFQAPIPIPSGARPPTPPPSMPPIPHTASSAPRPHGYRYEESYSSDSRVSNNRGYPADYRAAGSQVQGAQPLRRYS